MMCPLCRVEMAISNSTYKVSLDNEGSPKLVLEQELTCRSKKCSNYNKIVSTVRNPINNVVSE